MKQTAVEWLEIQLFKKQGKFNKSDIEQAKAMEKEMIIKASAIAYQDMFGSDGTEYGEEYYNITFKSE